MNFNVSRSLKTVKSVVTANSPVLLVGAAVAGVVATGVLAAKAGYKARGIVDEAEAERGPLKTQEKLSLTWLCYAPPVITGVSTIASCLGVHIIHTKRHAALAGLYAITANKLDDYRDEAEKLLGTKKSQQLNDSLAQSWLDEHPIDTSQITVVEGGTQLMLDMWTQRPFMSTMNKIDAAVNECNAMLIDEGELSLNMFYDRIGLEEVPMGDDWGWSGKDRVKIQYNPAINKDGSSVITISFRKDPRASKGIA